jgi:glycosyltransferase involved in cell wall biosynthesis
MRILYFSFVELDVPNACQTHTLGVLRGFSHHGCRVDALVPRPIYFRPEIPNVRFIYLWPWRFTPLARKWIKLLSFIIMVLLCLKNKYDAIYVREMETSPGPRLCSKLFNLRLYLEINDLLVPALLDDGLPSSIVEKVKNNQKLDFRQATGLIVPSVQMQDWIVSSYNLSHKKIHFILNGTEHSNIIKLSQDQCRRKIGLSPLCFCLGFLGNIYERFDFETLLKAFVNCRDKIPDLHLLIIGDGPMRPKIEKKTSELRLTNNVTFTGYIPAKELGGILPACDVGLVLPTKKAALRYGPVSTKLSAYASHELSVITAGYSMEGYPQELVRGLHLIPPESSEALVDIIVWLYKHPKKRKEKAKVLYHFCRKKLTWISVVEQTLEIMQIENAVSK